MTLQHNLIRRGAMAVLVGLLAFTTAPAHAGSLLAWGLNDHGQLGEGQYGSMDRHSPEFVPGFENGVSAVAVGAYYSLVIQDGAAKGWGMNHSGNLGQGWSDDTNPPGEVVGLTSGVTQLAAGVEHSLGIHNGAAKAWGWGVSGELGNQQFGGASVEPVDVFGLDSGVTAVAAGGAHSLAIHNGAAKAWGNNDYGQLGNGNNISSNIPVTVDGLDSGVTAIATGGSAHNLAIHNGAAKAWGYNGYGQLGNGTGTNSNVPVTVTGLGSGVTAIAGGSRHSLAIQDGNVWVWGYGEQGQLGYDITELGLDSSVVPIKVLDLEVDLLDVAAGNSSSYALSADGSLWVWGYNGYGQLGLGDITDRLEPTQLLAPEGYRFTAIAAGGSHALAIIEPVAIPEPGTVMLLGIGGVGLVAWRRRALRVCPPASRGVPAPGNVAKVMRCPTSTFPGARRSDLMGSNGMNCVVRGRAARGPCLLHGGREFVIDGPTEPRALRLLRASRGPRPEGRRSWPSLCSLCRPSPCWRRWG